MYSSVLFLREWDLERSKNSDEDETGTRKNVKKGTKENEQRTKNCFEEDRRTGKQWQTIEEQQQQKLKNGRIKRYNIVVTVALLLYKNKAKLKPIWNRTKEEDFWSAKVRWHTMFWNFPLVSFSFNLLEIVEEKPNMHERRSKQLVSLCNSRFSAFFV